jgi:hypothetical protein
MDIMERLGKAAFDEMKRRAVELWPDMAPYVHTARLEDLKRWDEVQRRWITVTVLTVDVLKRHDDQN